MSRRPSVSTAGSRPRAGRRSLGQRLALARSCSSSPWAERTEATSRQRGTGAPSRSSGWRRWPCSSGATSVRRGSGRRRWPPSPPSRAGRSSRPRGRPSRRSRSSRHSAPWSTSPRSLPSFCSRAVRRSARCSPAQPPGSRSSAPTGWAHASFPNDSGSSTRLRDTASRSRSATGTGSDSSPRSGRCSPRPSR